MNVRFMYAITATLATWISCLLIYQANEWMTGGFGLNPWLAIPLATIFIGFMPIWALIADEDAETELAERDAYEWHLEEQLDTMLARWDYLQKEYMSYCKAARQQKFELLQQLQEAQELLHVADGQAVPEDVVCMDKETWGALKNCRDRLVALDWWGYTDKFPEGMSKAEYRKQLYERMDILLQDLC